jgi:hypothetical protein
MDAHPTLATRTRRALLNDTMRHLTDLNRGRGVTLLVYDPARMARLKAAGRVPRTLMKV